MDMTKLKPRPKAMLCYICGKEFGTQSISIHEKQCKSTYEQQQDLLPPSQRRPLPCRPSVGGDATVDDRNAAAQQAYEDAVMVPCPGCGRTFAGQDRVDVHVRSCKAAKERFGVKPIRDCIVPGGSSSVESSPGGKGLGSKPKSVLCYICGKEYGTQSISIHEGQCAKRFEAQQELLPADQRKALPSRPLVAEGASREERNTAAQKTYEEQVMAACPGCGRTFSGQDRCDIHMRSCQAVKDSTPIKGIRDCIVPGAGGAGASSPSSSSSPGNRGKGKSPGARPKSVLCYICGKEFGTQSISIHEGQCAKRFEAQQELLPADQRKALPSRPLVAEGASREERNTAAQKTYEEQVMAACPGCGRTFSGQDRCDIHMRSCQAVKDSTPIKGIRDCIVPGAGTTG